MKITSIELLKSKALGEPYKERLPQVVCSWTILDNEFVCSNSAFKADFASYIEYSLNVYFDESLDFIKAKYPFDSLKCKLLLNNRKQDQTDIEFSGNCVSVNLCNELLYRSAINVLLSLDFYLEDKESQNIISTGNFSFLVNQTDENAAAMINYLNEEGPKYIFNKLSIGKDAQVQTHSDPSLEVLGKKIAALISAYDGSISFFKSNSYFNLKQEDRIEGFDKLRSFGSETLRFIVEHPDELTPYDKNTGINYKGRYYIPRHTLVSCNVKNYSIAENVIIVSFLHSLIEDVKKIIKLIDSSFSDYPECFLRDLSLNKIQGLTNAYQATNLKLFKDYLKSLTKIYALYRTILPVEEIKVHKCPRPTPIFLSVPGYRILYTKIREWFSFEISTYGLNDFGMSALFKCQLFEYYGLIKIIKKLEEKGFTLIENKMFEDNYDECDCPKSDFNNQYVFDNGDNLRANLIYQPIIHSIKYNNIGLYRSLSSVISSIQKLNKCHKVEWDKYNTRLFNKIDNAPNLDEDCYYTPDYLLSVTNKNTGITKFLIIDAKNKFPEYVVDEDLMNLVFKYQLSIKPANKSDVILGIDILCSKQQFSSGTVSPFEMIKNPISDNYEESFIKFHVLHPAKNIENFELNEKLFE